MSAVLGDLLQITDFQTYLGQNCLNVYHYRVVSVTGFTNDGYDAILDWFEDEVLAEVVEVQADGVSHNSLLIQNLSNGIDFVDRPLSPAVVGVRGANGLPPYAAWSFRMVRESLATRNGAKRYVGIGEIDQDNGVAGASILPDLQDIADAISSDIVVGLATLAEPVIVRRPINVPVGTSYIYSSVGSADYRGIGTQNTRKFGRGT